MRIERIPRWPAVLVLALVLTGCAAPGVEQEPPSATVVNADSPPARTVPLEEIDGSTRDVPPPAEPTRQAIIQRGTGRFLSEGESIATWQQTRRGDISLNFANADLREVIRVVLGEILKRNYIIDPSIQGRASLQTSRPLMSSQLVPVLESVLQLHGAALVENAGAYQVVPIGSAVRMGPAPVVASGPAAGFGTHIVPLKYVSASSMRKNLEPFVAPGSQVRIEEGRNLLIISGPGPTVTNLLETARLFDADWLQGMSFGVFPLQFSEPKGVTSELEIILELRNPEAPLSSLVRVEPVERLNALLVVSKQPQYIDQVGRLIGQLDLGLDSPGRRLYVYPVQHSTAEYIAGVLGELFVEPREKERENAQLAAARAAARAPAPAPAAPAPVAPPVSAAEPEFVDSGSGVPAPAPVPAATPSAPASGPESSSVESRGPINIIADESNNSVLILASPQDYRLVEAALRRLDVSPRQVLIEATIAEVTLNDRLQYGVQWFMEGTIDGYNATALSSQGSTSSIPGFAVPGFSFALSEGVNDVRFLFDVLDSESEVKILSSPKVLVVDNETASIRVGDQIPVITRQSSGSDENSQIVNEVQFRDTGVLLRVRPRIKAGGLVTLEINQEVSEPSADQFAAGNVSILQRTIESTIVVPSGEAVILGGLIRENKTLTDTGIPGLRDLPIVGKLFSRTVDSVNRTELLITITPRVIDNPRQAEAATDELRDRLKRVGDWMQNTQY